MKRLAALALSLLSASCSPTAEPSKRPPPAPTQLALHAPPGEAPAESPPPEPPAPPAPSASAAPAPYDIAADRARLLEEARRDLGFDPPHVVVRDVWLLIGGKGWGKGAMKGTAQFVDEVLTAYFNKRFDRGPTKVIPVYLFGDDGPYQDYCKKRYDGPCISHYGFYHPSDRRLVMNVGLGIGTLSHELVHPIIEADFPDAPTWLNEGIASLFEAPVRPREGEIHGAKNWRFRRLEAALSRQAEREQLSIERLVNMGDDAFRDGNEDLHYAVARYLCQWLDGQDRLWPFYRRYRDGFAGDRRGARAFEAATGMTPAEATAPWLRWLRSI